MKKLAQRQHAIDELVSTEKTYVDSMSKLLEHFVIFLRNNTPIISDEDYEVIFPDDIHIIIGPNNEFLMDMINAVESPDFDINATRIGSIFLSFCPHFRMYQKYVENYEAAAARLAELLQQPSSPFSAHCWTQTEAIGLPLESLLILPIQRLPRYKLLIEEIVKHTESGHPDLDDLRDALSTITEVNNSMNRKMKEQDSRMKVQAIENRFSGKLPVSLVTPSRRYLRQGQLCKIETKDDTDYLFMLFSDCILYASQSMIGDGLKYGNLLPFNANFKVSSAAVNPLGIQNLFEIHSTTESFMLYSSDRETMREWVEAIERAHSEYMAVECQDEEAKDETDRIFPAPLLLPDDFSEECMMTGCQTKFLSSHRSRHCMYCGLLVCAKCSANEMEGRPPAYSPSVPVRVCDECYDDSATNSHHKTGTESAPEASTTSITGLDQKVAALDLENESIWSATNSHRRTGTESAPEPSTTSITGLDQKVAALELENESIRKANERLTADFKRVVSERDALQKKVTELERQSKSKYSDELEAVDTSDGRRGPLVPSHSKPESTSKEPTRCTFCYREIMGRAMRSMAGEYHPECAVRAASVSGGPSTHSSRINQYHEIIAGLRSKPGVCADREDADKTSR